METVFQCPAGLRHRHLRPQPRCPAWGGGGYALCLSNLYMAEYKLMMLPFLPRYSHAKSHTHTLHPDFLRKAPRAVFRLLTSFSLFLVNCMFGGLC